MENLFKNNKYSKWYYGIVQNAKKADRIKSKDEYFESHHIIPKSFGGSNKKENLVLLTPREHFLCHLLLPKMMFNPVYAGKMVYAFFRMRNKHKNSRLFDRFRSSYGSLTTGENNPFYGRTHSEDTKQKISRLGKYHTEESKNKMSESKRGKKVGKDNPMFGKVRPAEWREEHSKRLQGSNHFNYGKPSFCKGKIWINDSKKSKMIDPALLQTFLQDGWVQGRLPHNVKLP